MSELAGRKCGVRTDIPPHSDNRSASHRAVPGVVSERVFRWWDYPVFAAITLVTLTAFVYFFSYWGSARDWAAQPITFTLLTLILVFNLGVHQLRWFSLPLMRRPRPMPPRPGRRVAVATTFVPDAEPLEMLEETVAALVAMDYSHATWVLDEGDDDRVKAVCERLGARHFSRKHLPQYQAAAGTFASRTKYGNYNAWLEEFGYNGYDIIVAFDPDHIPRRDFLTEVIGYFEDPRVGYVQPPQAYYNQKASFVARGAAEETYAYYSSIQMVNHALGYPIVTGCHNAHRTSALQQIGGFAPHDADDLLITMLYRAAGWRGVYVPKILARGMTPVDWPGYLVQQRRWARSVLDVKFRRFPNFAAALPWSERLLGFVHGIYYVRSSLVVLGLVALALMLLSGRAPDVVSLGLTRPFIALWLALGLTDVYRQRFFLDRREWGVHWRIAVLELAKWPYFLAALWDTLRGSRNPYSITPKKRFGTTRRMLLAPHAVTGGLVACAWLAGSLLLRHAAPLVVQVSGAAVVMGSLVVVASEGISFPPPYDPDLAAAWSIAAARQED